MPLWQSEKLFATLYIFFCFYFLTFMIFNDISEPAWVNVKQFFNDHLTYYGRKVIQTAWPYVPHRKKIYTTLFLAKRWTYLKFFSTSLEISTI